MSQAVQLQISQPYWADTDTPLGANATFAGVARNLGAPTASFKTFCATFFSPQASAANGAKLQMSNDGVTWVTAAQGAVAANVPLVLTATVMANYYRVTLTNGATLQTALNINSAASPT